MTAKRTALRHELDALASRDESLQKEKNSALMKAKELTNKIDEMLEAALLEKTIDYDDEGGAQTLSRDQLLVKLARVLETKGELAGEQALTLEGLKALESEYSKRVKELEAIEDKFNQCVAIIPETDENTMRLTHEIQKLKDRLETANREFSEAKESLNRVRQLRKDRFLSLFDKVSAQLPVNYRELTRAAGTANLLISDRTEKPFDSPIIFDFCPPGKRHGVDLDLLSGGEKTMAALAFILALVQVVKPALLVMDEVDAFLDADNVTEISSFLRDKLNHLARASG